MQVLASPVVALAYAVSIRALQTKVLLYALVGHTDCYVYFRFFFFVSLS